MNERTETGKLVGSVDRGAPERLRVIEMLLGSIGAEVEPLEEPLRSKLTQLVAETGAWLKALPRDRVPESAEARANVSRERLTRDGVGQVSAPSVGDEFGRSDPNVDEPGRQGGEIRARVQTWAGGPEEAGRWYRSQPIAAFGNRTAKSLVKSGQAEALRDYLDSIALGGYA